MSRVWRAGTCRIAPSTVSAPGARYGWKPRPKGISPSSSDCARVVTRQALPAHVVVDLEQEREGVAGRGVELQAQGELVLMPGLERPGHPADQAVDGVAALRLVQRRLGPHPVELEAAVGQAVGPGGEHLAPARVGPLVGAEAVEHRGRADGVGPEGGADLADDDLLAAVPDPPLLPGR